MNANHKAAFLLSLENSKPGLRLHGYTRSFGPIFAPLTFTHRIFEPNQLNLSFFQGGA
jgi:hypothetical protein